MFIVNMVNSIIFLSDYLSIITVLSSFHFSPMTSRTAASTSVFHNGCWSIVSQSICGMAKKYSDDA